MSPREKRTGMDKVAEYHELLESGQSALKSARWDEARTCFERALRLHDTAEAHDGLGIVLWWLNELVAAHDHRTAACMGFKQQGDLRRAGFIAAWLAREQVFLHGNSSAMNGWFAHAERLLRNGEDCPEYGWFVLLRASMSAPPVQLQETALAVGKIAATWQDSTLGAVALAFLGVARVSLGNVDEGMSSLDEAMAVALSGEVDNLMAISEIFCVMLSACELASDLVRCEQWCQAAADFARRYDCSFLSAYCRTTYGSLMTATGRWQEADSALQDAMGLFAAGHRGLRVHALLKLADLRIFQGRLEEAELLLAGHEDHSAALLPLARLHLAKGEIDLARAVLEQGLRSAPAPALHRAPLLMLLVEVQLLLDKPEAAYQAAEELASLAQKTGSGFLLAQADLAKGQVKRRTGAADVTTHFEVALARLHRYEQSNLAGRVRLEMAQVLESSDQAGAITWARAALATFERIGARHDAETAAGLLRRLGVAARPYPREDAPLTQREREVLSLLAVGLTNREIAERLVISLKTVEHHVSQILSKLGLRSRTEAAAFVAGHWREDQQD